MKDSLVRFGVAMESSLITELDRLAEVRGCNRSELLRDLTRAELSRSALDAQVPAFAAVTLVYNHHVRELSERLTALQHDLGEQVRSSMHVHLDHEHCLEVIVMRGRSDELKAITGRMIGTRGVIHGGAEYLAEDALHFSGTGRRLHPHDGQERHAHPHVHAPSRSAKTKRTTRKALRGKARRSGPGSS
jgi:CopG family nickel-responsive transcriptional regulator